MRVFISHSSKDNELASRVVELLRSALNLRSDDIRYTSEAGYGLPAGSNIEQGLRQDVSDAEVLIGLLTPNSLSSIYVIFELGARWGMKKTNVYLYAKGMTPEGLGSPLKDYNGLYCSDTAHMHRLVEDVANRLNVNPNRTSSFVSLIEQICELASVVDNRTVNASDTEVRLDLSDEAKVLLREASQDTGGNLLVSQTNGGMELSTNGEHFVKTKDSRQKSLWIAALEELSDRGLVEDRRGSGQVLSVTHTGFKVADELDSDTARRPGSQFAFGQKKSRWSSLG